MTMDELSLLDELLEQESGLTGWEMDFLDNLDQNWRDRQLTEKQRMKLDVIGQGLGLVG